MKLFNRAEVKSAANRINGEFISYDMRREVAEVTGAAPGQPGSGEKPRVKMTIIPQSQKNPGAPGKQEAPKEPIILKPDKEVGK